jgi:ABC-type phosphate/phosphonate transport system substrate-binding protein
LVYVVGIGINSPASWSGHSSLKQWLVENNYQTSDCVISGSHQHSLHFLRLGNVEEVAIDAHSWSLLDTDQATIIKRSQVAPTPPFITKLGDEAAQQRLTEALMQSLDLAGHSIGIAGILPCDREIYRPLTIGIGKEPAGTTPLLEEC